MGGGGGERFSLAVVTLWLTHGTGEGSGVVTGSTGEHPVCWCGPVRTCQQSLKWKTMLPGFFWLTVCYLCHPVWLQFFCNSPSNFFSKLVRTGWAHIPFCMKLETDWRWKGSVSRGRLPATQNYPSVAASVASHRKVTDPRSVAHGFSMSLWHFQGILWGLEEGQ